MCAAGVQTALDQGDYEVAAGHISRYLNVDAEVLASTLEHDDDDDDGDRNTDEEDDVDDTTNEDDDDEDDDDDGSDGGVGRRRGHRRRSNRSKPSAGMLLQHGERQLRELCREQFDAAVASDNETNIERFFRIFPLLNQHQFGLDRYMKNVVCVRVRRANEDNVAKLMSRFDHKQGERKNVVNQFIVILIDVGEESVEEAGIVDALAGLFELVAKQVQGLTAVVSEHYGSVWMLVVAQVLHTETQVLAGRLIDMWKERHQFGRKVQENSQKEKEKKTTILNIVLASLLN